MQRFTQYPMWARALALFLIVSISGFFIHTSRADEEVEGEAIPVSPELLSLEKSEMFGYAVSGVITASDSVTVRARTGGTVMKKLVYEGSVVKKGDVLLTQDIPLLQERMALQQAQNDMGGLMQDAALIGRTAEQESAFVMHNAASTSVALTENNITTQTESATALLTTQIYGSVTSLVAALDFIDANKSRFSSKDLSAFRQTVDALYGSNRAYLSGSVQYSFHSHADILDFLDALTEKDMYPDATALVNIGELIDAELTATKLVFVSGERDFLDAKIIPQSDPRYSAYLTYRGSVIEAQANLRMLIGTVRTAQTGGALGTHGVLTENTLRTIGYTTATQIRENAVQMATQSDVVSSAALGILSGEGELGQPKAPFDGVVDTVFVHEGDFISPGTPLFTLVGSGARELHVSVPNTMLPYLKVGAPVTTAGNVVGYVDRFSSVATGGNIPVVIQLTDSEGTVGETFRGEIQCELPTESAFAVPHAFLFFDTHGAFVRTESGAEVRITIIHDTGKIFVVKPEQTITEKIRKAVGVAF
jgi:multidrug efflux pump subunit AcrA (membrane-fusion protein)